LIPKSQRPVYGFLMPKFLVLSKHYPLLFNIKAQVKLHRLKNPIFSGGVVPGIFCW